LAKDSFFKTFNKSDHTDTTEKIVHLDIDGLKPNPYQPRRQFDPIQMEELSRSIAENGIIQPIIVRLVDEQYEIIAGERRWRAAIKAGLKTIPSIVRNMSDSEVAQIALIENLQRADLNYFEEAEGYRKLIEEFRLTQEEVALKVGKSQPAIANKMRILRIDPIVKESIMVELLTERHVRALLRLRTADEQLAVLKDVYEKDLTVKETEELIAAFLEGRIEIGGANDDAVTEDEPKGQTIRRVISDYRIYVNTIRAAVKTIMDSGVDVTMEQTETDEGMQLTILIPPIKR